MDKIDRLFIVRDCPDCAVIRAELDIESVMDDDFRGTEGQELRVFSALSDDAGRELIDVFDAFIYRGGSPIPCDESFNGQFAPVLVTHEGKVYHKVNEIQAYIRRNGMVMKDG